MKDNYPDSLTIKQYFEGKLDPSIAHELEKQALEDPFLWEALEGYAAHQDAAADLSLLQRQLHERIVHLQENKKVFDLTWQRLSVAAAAAVLFVSAGILFWMNSNRPDETIAAAHPKQVDVTLVDPDSIDSVIHAADEPVIAAAPVQREADNARLSVPRPELSPQSSAATKPEASGQPVASAVVAEEETTVADLAEVKIAARMATANASSVQPKGGWEAFHEYIAKNAKKPQDGPAVKGSVMLSVKIEGSGKLGEVRVVRGLTPFYNDEAIRLLREGPEWIPAADGNESESLVEINFQP